VVNVLLIEPLQIFQPQRQAHLGQDNPPRPLVGARPKIPLAIKRKAIGAATRFHEGGELAIDAPFENSIIRLIGKEHVSLSIGSRAFGKNKIACEFLKRLTRGDDFAVGSKKGCSHKKKKEKGQPRMNTDEHG